MYRLIAKLYRVGVIRLNPLHRTGAHTVIFYILINLTYKIMSNIFYIMSKDKILIEFIIKNFLCRFTKFMMKI